MMDTTADKSRELLRKLPLFAGLPEADLERLLVMAQPVSLQPGDVLMEEGSAGEELYVVVQGAFTVTHRSGVREVVLSACGPGDVIGEISLLEHSVRTATVRATTPSRLLRIGGDEFESLLAGSPQAALAVVRTVATRLRNTEAMLRHSEKMAALGTLAAGLAHELNNPAAAVRRGAGQLREAMAALQRATAELDGLGLTPAQIDLLRRLRAELPVRPVGQTSPDALAKAEAEETLQGWLDEQGAANPWELAPALADLGWTTTALAEVAGPFPGAQRPVFLTWLAGVSQVYSLLSELRLGAERISEVVAAVKSYSHLDQAPIKAVDVREGLENTLVILRHKLKAGVKVVREYGDDLPSIEAYAGELNQVWTNLIDNAVDAMDGRGTLTLRTSVDERHVLVEIADTGPGIPPEVRPRIFDAFYTTKGPGKGTGLGLHLAYNIVVQQHGGEITFDSRPGSTTFTVKLPLRLAG